MTPTPYTEDTLVQQTTANYLEQQLGWRSVLAQYSEGVRSNLLLGSVSSLEVAA